MRRTTIKMTGTGSLAQVAMLAVVIWPVLVVSAQGLELTVTAGESGIPTGPIGYKPSEELDPWEDYCLIGPDVCIPTQLDREGTLWWWQLKPIGAGESVTYKLSVVGSGTMAIDGGLPIRVKKVGTDQVLVTADGKTFTTLVCKKDEVKPYLYPLVGPTDEPVTRDFPMKDNPMEKENGRQDHPHHRSLWCAHGEVTSSAMPDKKCNFWHEPSKDGKPLPVDQCDRQVVKKIVRTVSGLVFGQITLDIDWMPANSEAPLFTEERTYLFFADKDVRMIDTKSVFKFADGDVTFGDTKEGGVIAMRLAVTMDEKGAEKPEKVHGQMTNSEGKVGEGECWGKPAAWCDYVGPVGGATVGVAILDHPKNFGYPTRWHIRAYGLYTANPFGLSAFTEKEEKKLTGGHTWDKGEEAEFCYRVILHKGDSKAARIADEWKLYAEPLKIAAK